jgi:hypothetical protein
MSQTTVITAGQSLLDVAIQELGSVEALFDLADAAGLAITDELTPGAVLPVPFSAASKPDIVGYFYTRQQRINTGYLPFPIQLPALGGYFSDLFFSPAYLY